MVANQCETVGRPCGNGDYIGETGRDVGLPLRILPPDNHRSVILQGDIVICAGRDSDHIAQT